MVDLGDRHIRSNSGATRGLHLRCPRAGLAQAEPDQIVGEQGRSLLPSLTSQDSLLSQQTLLSHMCEELI